VRFEISLALQTDKEIIPVLVGDVGVPPAGHLPEPIRALVSRHARSLSTEHWHEDCERLEEAVRAWTIEAPADGLLVSWRGGPDILQVYSPLPDVLRDFRMWVDRVESLQPDGTYLEEPILGEGHLFRSFELEAGDAGELHQGGDKPFYFVRSFRDDGREWDDNGGWLMPDAINFCGTDVRHKGQWRFLIRITWAAQSKAYLDTVEFSWAPGERPSGIRPGLNPMIVVP
jgi:hypothetical protein